MNGPDIKELLPEIDQIGDATLRDKVVHVWETALERSTFTDLGIIPFTLLIEDLDDTLVEHTGRVTRTVASVAQARGDLDMDTVLAGALLHDVGKRWAIDCATPCPAPPSPVSSVSPWVLYT